MINLDDELVQDYLSECSEQLASIETDLFAIEMSGPDGNKERLKRAFHAAHWVKTGAGFFNLMAIREAAQTIEEALGLMRSRKASPKSEDLRALLSANDELRELIRNPQSNARSETGSMLTRLKQQSSTSAPGSTGATPGRRLRILLAEDDFASRLLLQTFMSRFGECDIAVNGREAVEAFQSALEHNHGYDLICMDIMMPEMDGREAVRRVRAIEEEHGILSTSGAKIIMTTAVDEVREVVRCFKELCDAYLMKPIDLAQLLGHMRACRLID